MSAEQPEDLLSTFLAETDRHWRDRQRPLPNIVYHYTSASALRAILESQRIWATITSEANDTTELSYAVDMWKTVINRHALAAALPEYQALYPPQALTFDYLRGSKGTLFISCFSGKQDDLPQWTRYADNCKGVAIGFLTAELVRLDRASVRQNIGFFGIEYDETRQCDSFDWLLNLWERAAAPALGLGLRHSTNPFLYIARWFGPLATSALSLFPRMKTAFFQHEDEWRVAHLHIEGTDPCCDVHSNDHSKTHVELDLGQLKGKLPIVSVWLGPSIANDDSVALTRQLLENHGYRVPIECSRGPLRVAQRVVEF